jgi:cytochrome P450
MSAATAAAAVAPTYDLFAPAVLRDPTEVLTRMRAENPVYFSPQLRGYMITRYDDISTVLKDQDMGQALLSGWIDQLPPEARAQLGRLRASLDLFLGHKNTEDHLRVQRVMRRYFTPGTLEGLRPRVEQLVTMLFDQLEGQRECDFLSAIASPLPGFVSGLLLGVPREDRIKLQNWTLKLNNVFRITDLPELLQTQEAVVGIEEYMRPIVEERRRAPQEDLPSVLAAAQRDGQLRGDEEILSNCVAMLFGGHETTVALIANTLLALLQNPEQLRLLQARPELIASAVEEGMRYDGPVDLITRVTYKDLKLVGGEVPANNLLILTLRAGSRDPEVYSNPHTFDITRDPPVRGLAFGLGAYYCLGTALARMEAQLVLREVLKRMPGIRPLFDVNRPDHAPMPPIRRRLESLRVAID